MPTNARRWHLCVAFLAAAIFLVSACSGKDEKKEDDKVGDKKGVGDTRPQFSLTSKEFAEEYKKDRQAAEDKYKDKVVELSGLVAEVRRDSSKENFLLLEGAEKDISGVACYTTDKEPWRQATPGQTVKLRGRWREFALAATLDGCVVMKVTGPAAPSLTADELAKEYAADPDATSKKYDRKYLFVRGEVAL